MISTRNWAPYYSIGLGSVLGILLAFEVVAVLLAPAPIEIPFLVTVVTSIPFLLVLLVGGVWLRRGGLPRERHPRIAYWSIGGLLLLLCTFVPLLLYSSENWWEIFGGNLWAATIGGGAGMLIGLFEARAIRQAQEATTARITAEEAERRQRMLDYLNSLLRHEVLNTANIIAGYADRGNVASELPEVTEESLETIRRQAEDLTGITEDVRLLLDVNAGTPDVKRTDLVPIIEDELRKLHDRFEAVETEADLPEEAHVEADRLVRRVFSNLLDNAVEHNSSEVTEVVVRVSEAAGDVKIRIEDNGPGVDEAEREMLFSRDLEYGGGHGLGHLIVARLVARYGGAVELTETGPDGTTVTVTLPSACG